MATSKNPLKQVDFTAPNIKAQQIQAPKATGQNYATADWSGLGEGIADIGDSVAKGMSASKNAVEEVDKQMDAADWKDAPGMRDKIDKSNALIEEDAESMNEETPKFLSPKLNAGFTNLTAKPRTPLQQLGCDSKGFKLRAFKNN
tara:strand:+ start:359 stop:793 length:435 start_codon:yes stop_codon:yes gene_type:complete